MNLPIGALYQPWISDVDVKQKIYIANRENIPSFYSNAILNDSYTKQMNDKDDFLKSVNWKMKLLQKY